MTARGRHFLQIPGPSPVPDACCGRSTPGHRPPRRRSSQARPEVLSAQGGVPDPGPVVIYPSSGTGAWEAAIVNTLSPGDRC